MNRPLIFYGAIVHASTPTTLELVENGVLLVDADGRISAFYADADNFNDMTSHIPDNVQVHKIPPGDFLIPGFVDTHNHAPQWSMRGLGQGLHILDWLEKVTFPHEARCADPLYARRIYNSCVDGFLRQGVTTASYYGSKHIEATRILANVCLAKGQRALVGKCNMDRNAPDFLRDESAAMSLRETEECIGHIASIDPEGALIRSVLTPRFAICCTRELLQGLGRLALHNPRLAVQTHFNEAQQEIQATRSLFPEFESEADLYESFGLMNDNTILAHCTHMTEYDMDRVKALKCGVAHCPISNMTVGGGFMVASIRDFLRRGVKVGLGTDSGGGFSSSMLDTIRQAMIASNAREVLSGGKDKALSIAEVFGLATLGGADVCGLGDEIGNFMVGKQFDACWVSSNADGIMTMREEGDSLQTCFEKFIMTGDDRNIARVYVRGRMVKGQ